MNAAAPQPDPKAMEALMAKVARLQKILGFFAWSQALLGICFLLLPYFAFQATQAFGFMALAPFLFGLAYAANFAKKDLTFARAVFRNTAISEIGLFIVSLIGMFVFNLPVVFWALVAASLLIGGLAGMVIYQALKEQK